MADQIPTELPVEVTPEPSEAATQEPTDATPVVDITGQTDETIWQRVPDLDPDELVRKSPRLQGKVGDLAAKQAAQYIRDYRAAEEAGKAEAERVRLRREDPLRYAELDDEADEKRKVVAEQSQTQSRTIEAWVDRLPPEVQAKVKTGKRYPGTYAEGMQMYLEDVSEVLAEHKALRFLAQREKVMREAIRKEILGERGSAEPTADISGGRPVGGFRSPSVEDVENMSLADWRANKDKIIASLR